MPLRRWPPKTILKTGFYVSAGLVTVIYTFLTFQANFIRLEIDTAPSSPYWPLIRADPTPVANCITRVTQFCKTPQFIECQY